MVKAEDNGVPKKSQQARVSIAVVEVPGKSENPPVLKTIDQHVEVTESDTPGFLVALIQAVDYDGEQLWYDIVGKWFSFYYVSILGDNEMVHLH